MSKFLLPAAATAAALMVGGLSAQTKYVSPAAAAKSSGNYNIYWPFRPQSIQANRYARYQEIMDLPSSAKGKLSSIALRAGTVHASRGAPPAFSVTMEVKVSTATNTAATMINSFASNEGKDSTVVMAKKVMKFAKYPLLPRFPQPFFFKVPFDKNKVLAFVGNKSLCLDMTAYDNSLYNATTRQYTYFYPDSVSFLSGYGIQSHEGRPGFSSRPGSFLPYYGYTYANIRTYGTVGLGNLQIYAYSYNAPQGSAAFHILTAAKMPVGIPLVDGNSLYVNLGTVLAVTPSASTTTYGSIQFPKRVSGKPISYILDTPFQKAWRGARVYGQSFLLDAKANKAGIVSTQLNIVELPAYYQKTGYPLSHMYEYKYGTRTYKGFRKGYGHVTELTFN